MFEIWNIWINANCITEGSLYNHWLITTWKRNVFLNVVFTFLFHHVFFITISYHFKKSHSNCVAGLTLSSFHDFCKPSFDLILTFQSPTRLSVSELTSDLEQVKTHFNLHWSTSLSALCLFFWIYRIDIFWMIFFCRNLHLGTVEVVPFLAI